MARQRLLPRGVVRYWNFPGNVLMEFNIIYIIRTDLIRPGVFVSAAQAGLESTLVRHASVGL